MNLNLPNIAAGGLRRWPLGALALVLAVASWSVLLAGVVLYLSSATSPGDGSQALASVHGWLMAALWLLVVCSVASSVASVLAWRWHRGRAAAAVAALLLSLLMLVVAVPLLA